MGSRRTVGGAQAEEEASERRVPRTACLCRRDALAWVEDEHLLEQVEGLDGGVWVELREGHLITV